MPIQPMPAVDMYYPAEMQPCCRHTSWHSARHIRTTSPTGRCFSHVLKQQQRSARLIASTCFISLSTRLNASSFLQSYNVVQLLERPAKLWHWIRSETNEEKIVLGNDPTGWGKICLSLCQTRNFPVCVCAVLHFFFFSTVLGQSVLETKFQ